MCFSATASFSAGLALLVCGIAALHKAKQKKIRMLAAVPLIFGIQQIVEGFVWLSFTNPNLEGIRFIASTLFLAFAGIVWPLWIPIAVSRFEQTGKYYMICIAAGALFALASLWYMIFSPATVTANCNLIYSFDTNILPYLHAPGSLLYILATIVPFFISKNRTLWYLGTLISLSYVVSYLFYAEAFTSVWCFFAALISILVYGFVYDESRKHSKSSHISHNK